MFTLYTGTPGAGKTLSAVTELLTLVPAVSTKQKIAARILSVQLPDRKPTRPVYVHGIPDLSIEHTLFYCASSSCQFCTDNKPVTGALMVEEWRQWVPDGAFVIFDEAQHCFRPAPSGSPVPDHIAYFETHRHRGIDGVIITQHPKLIHANVRRLLSRHIHITRTFAGTFKYEWPEVSDDPRKVQDAVKSIFAHNKNVYSLYRSATQHTKHKLRIPLPVYGVLLALPVVAYLGYRTFTTVGIDSPTVIEIETNLPGQLPDIDITNMSRLQTEIQQQTTYHPLKDYQLYLVGVSVFGDLITPTFVVRQDGFQDYQIHPAVFRSMGYQVMYIDRCAVNIQYIDGWSNTYFCSPPPQPIRQENESRGI
jgi:hypothetical protein